MKNITRFLLVIFSVLSINILFNSTKVLAATVTWDGDGGTSGGWSNAINWDNDTLPVDGDDLVFPCSDLSGCASVADLDIEVNSISMTGVGTHEATMPVTPAAITVNGDITSEAEGSKIHANFTIGANIEIHNVMIAAYPFDLNGFIVTLTGNGQLRSNGANPGGPDGWIGIGGQITGDGELIIDVDPDTEVYLSSSITDPSDYTGITRIISGRVGTGMSLLIAGQHETDGNDSLVDSMFGQSDVEVEQDGKILFFLDSSNNNLSIDNMITLSGGSLTNDQLEFINLTDDNSNINFAVPNIVLESDSRFDATTYNGDVLIDLDGIDNAGLYCVSYGNNNEDASNFENGPNCTPPATPSCSLTSNLSTITDGGSVILTWVATDATTVTLSGPGIVGAQTVTPPNGGTITMTPPSGITSATYTLNATGPGGACTPSTVTITITPATSAATCSLTASSSSITAGQSVTLNWTLTGATSGTITGGGSTHNLTVPPNTGTLTVTPPSGSSSATYTLNATGPGGACTASAVNIAIQPVAPTDPDPNPDDPVDSDVDLTDAEYVPDGVEEEESVVPGVGKTGIANDTPKAVTIATAGTGAILVIMKAGFWLLRKR
jgi:hypothetical protein